MNKKGPKSVKIFVRFMSVVGRPLTPVSVAGVARRTVRRCALGVYNCRLPDPPGPTDT